MNKADYTNLYVDLVGPNRKIKMQKRVSKPRRLNNVGFYKAFTFGTIFWTMFFILAAWTYK